MSLAKNLAEWKEFVAELDPAELAAAAEEANTARWVYTMMESGAEASDVQNVLVLLAKRLRKLGFVPPSGGYVDLNWLADQ